MLKTIVLAIIHFYQRFISPLFPPSCRYTPTCSQYTVQAVQRFGGVKGSLMGIARILRCNPFVPGGEDPVPDHFSLRRSKPNEFNGVK